MKDPDRVAPRPGPADGGSARYCVEYAKDGPARWLGQLDFQEAVERALRRARLPLRFGAGYHPRPRLQFEDPLALGWRSECERLWVELERPYPPAEILRRVRAAAPPGMRVLRAYLVPRREAPQARRYRIVGPELPADARKRLRLAFPDPGGSPAVQLEGPEAAGGRTAWEVTLRPAGAPAPPLKKVLQALFGRKLPAGLEVLRLRWPGPGGDSR